MGFGAVQPQSGTLCMTTVGRPSCREDLPGIEWFWTLLAAAALLLQGLCLIEICSMTVWCTCRQKDGKGKVKLSKQEQDAAKRREQIAAAAEARIARLKLVSEQQQLWCSCLIPTVWEVALHNLISCSVDTCSEGEACITQAHADAAGDPSKARASQAGRHCAKQEPDHSRLHHCGSDVDPCQAAELLSVLGCSTQRVRIACSCA